MKEDMKDLTWSQFVTIGEDVKEKTGKWFVAFIPNRGTHYLQMAMQSAGLWYFDEEGKIFLERQSSDPRNDADPKKRLTRKS